LTEDTQENGLADFVRQCLHVGTRHTARREQVGRLQSQPGEHWSESIATGLRLLLHKAACLERHQQAMHRAFGATWGPGNIRHPSPFWACFESHENVKRLD